MKKTYFSYCIIWIVFLGIFSKELGATGNWAIKYDFSDTRDEWNKQLHLPDLPRKFYEDPDFIEAIRPIKDSKISLGIDHPLIGILCFRVTAKRIGLAPLKANYNQDEISFLKRQMFGLAAALQMKMNDFKWVSHNLRDVSEDDRKKEEEKLKNKKENLSTKRLALRTILYSMVPWRQLEGLGKFAQQRDASRYTADDDVVLKAALPSLINEFRLLTDTLGYLINFYQEEMLGEIKWNLPNPTNFPAITILGSFTRDIDSLQRVEELLSMVSSNSLEHNNSKFRYALLRALNVIGECSITISSVVKKRIATEESWDAYKKIRNAFHDANAQEQLHNILLNLRDASCVNALLSDFALFLPRIETEKQRVRGTWAHVLNFYTGNNPADQPLHLKSLINLQRKISGHLTLYEEEDLINLTRHSFILTHEALAFIKKTLLEDETVNHEDRKSFMTQLDKLKVSKSEKSKLEEPYKKRCTAQKQGQNSKLSDSDQRKVRDVLESEGKKQSDLEKLAKNIHSYTNWTNLEKILKELGFSSDEDLKVWEKYHKITKLPQLFQKNKISTTQQKITILCERILGVLEKLKSLFLGYDKILPTERIDVFLKDHITSLAGYYLIACFRQDAQNLWELLSSAASGEKNALAKAADTLDQYISRAKEILHNHDITEMSTLSSMGENIGVIFKDLPLLLGELFGLEFLLKDTSIKISLVTGHEVKLSIVDARRLLSKKERKGKDYGIKANTYPILTPPEKLAATLWLNMSKGKNYPLKEFYDNLTLSPFVNPRYLLYTPPQKGQSLFSLLQQLSLGNKNFLKPHQKPSVDKVTVVSEQTGETLDRTRVIFEEIEIPEDNDCALHCLGLSRKDAEKLLLDNSTNEEIRDLVADEIFAAFMEEVIPKRMQDNEYQRLRTIYLKANQDLDELVRTANERLGVSGKTAQELLDSYSINQLNVLDELRGKQQDLNNIIKDISDYTRKKEVFENFVKSYVGQSGQWLSYIRGLGRDTRTTSLDALAKLKRISLTIWIKDAKTNSLYIVHTFNGINDNHINMFHTHGLTHFNLLRKK